jgi:hypothetical protein
VRVPLDELLLAAPLASAGVGGRAESDYSRLDGVSSAAIWCAVLINVLQDPSSVQSRAQLITLAQDGFDVINTYYVNPASGFSAGA